MASKESVCEGGDVGWCAPVETQENTRQLRTFAKLTADSQMHITHTASKCDFPVRLTKNI